MSATRIISVAEAQGRCALGLLLLLAMPLAARAQSLEPESYDRAAIRPLARGWSAFYNHEPKTAMEAVDRLTRSQQASTRLHALHLKARSLWLSGDPVSRQQAQGLWTRLDREGRGSGDAFAAARVAIARALHLAEQGQRPQAIEWLERVRKQPLPSVVSVEAAIELALLYAEAKRPKDAEAQLDAAGEVLAFAESHNIPKAIEEVFARAIRQTRESIKHPGRPLYLRARGMQREGQFAQAADLFAAVVRDYAGSDYALRSDLEIGHCLAGMKRHTRAAEQWKTFIASAPAGPWRGQAFVALIDLYLDQWLDLAEAGKYAELARSSLPTALADEKAGESWKAVAFDVHLRVGLVSFCQNRGPVAAEAFAQAHKLAPTRLVAESLDPLIVSAKSGGAVIPQDCAASATSEGGGKAALALSMGVIHSLAGQHDKADAYFDRVSGAPGIPASAGKLAAPPRAAMSGASRAQVAFALFGKGMVLQAQKKPDAAKEQFLASTKTFPSGSWHDESLYRLAIITQDQAEAKWPKPAEPARNDAAKSPTPQERDAQAKAEKERLANLLKAKGESLPYWQELIKKYPTSPRCEQAFYHTGALLHAMAEASPADKSEQLWKDAEEAFRRLCETYPTSFYLGAAYVRRIDLALERKFDLEQSNTLTVQALQWAKDRNIHIATKADGTVTPASLAEASKAIKASSTEVAAWSTITPPSASGLVKDLYDLYLRAGILAYLQDKYDEAVAHLNAAGPARPTDGMEANFDLEKVGLFVLSNACKREQPAWYADAINEATSDKQKLALKLADTYLFAQRPDKAEAIYQQLFRTDSPLGRPPTSVEADLPPIHVPVCMRVG